MAMTIISSVFRAGEVIPTKYSCEGANVSPPVQWDGVPAAARSLALICDDPDAPMGTWVHWLLYNLPTSVSNLPEHVPASEMLSSGAKQGMNDFKRIGYGGPCPPPGKTHRYYFKLYALDVELALKPRATKQNYCARWKVTSWLKHNSWARTSVRSELSWLAVDTRMNSHKRTQRSQRIFRVE